MHEVRIVWDMLQLRRPREMHQRIRRIVLHVRDRRGERP